MARVTAGHRSPSSCLEGTCRVVPLSSNCSYCTDIHTTARTDNAVKNHWNCSLKQRLEKFIYSKNIEGRNLIRGADGRYLIGDDFEGCLLAVREGVRKYHREPSRSPTKQKSRDQKSPKLKLPVPAVGRTRPASRRIASRAAKRPRYSDDDDDIDDEEEYLPPPAKPVKLLGEIDAVGFKEEESEESEEEKEERHSDALMFLDAIQTMKAATPERPGRKTITDEEDEEEQGGASRMVRSSPRNRKPVAAKDVAALHHI